MSNLVFLDAERRKREPSPDRQFVRETEDGHTVYLFVNEYDFEGGKWSFELWAENFAEAQARLDAIKASAALTGQLYERFEV